MTRLCFDYDATLYKVGFAAETRHIVATHKHSGDSQQFANRTEFYSWLETFNEGKGSPHDKNEYEIHDVQELRSFHLIQEILNASIGNVCKVLQAKDYYGYVGKGKTFRHEQATILEYKGQRSSLKPLAIGIVEELLFEGHNAKLAPQGLESDDAMIIDSCTAWKDWIKTKHNRDRLIIVTPDKDARGCSNIHLFNPDRMRLPKTINGFGKLYWRDDTSKEKLDGHGFVWFLAQMLMGDTVDNISPNYLYKQECKRNGQKAKGFGDVAAYNLLKECKTFEEGLAAIIAQYKSWYPEPVEYISWDGKEMVKDWLGIAEEMWMLLRMRRWEDDTMTMQDVLNKLGVSC